jgi:hypothetical protein
VTIQYVKKKFPPPPFDGDVELMQYFRDLYYGNHEAIFPRAQELAKLSQQIAKPKLIRRGGSFFRRVKPAEAPQYHYVMVNLAPLVAELPADLINRAIGNISADTEKDESLLSLVESVTEKSKIQARIWAAIVQHQVDGGIAYLIRRSPVIGVYFEWKPADLFFEHEDGLGADVAWTETRDDKDYLRVERQRLEITGLTITQLVFQLNNGLVETEIDIQEYASKFPEADIPENVELLDVKELMCGYLANDETLLAPRGRSGLRNIDGIQEEINWTITRDSIVFEKHGKPKLAIPRTLWDSVANKNHTRYGDRFVRSADLEVVSYDEKNGALPQYIVWDAKLDQSFKHVERLIDYMMAVSKTSPQAAGIKEGKGDSGIALLYLWIQSVIKAEAIKDKFDATIKDAYRKCIILENAIAKTAYNPIKPVIEWQDMLPKAESERDKEESEKYDSGVQSLETTVRRIHPDWSEDAIQAEVKKIQDEKTADSFSPVFAQPPKTNVGVE